MAANSQMGSKARSMDMIKSPVDGNGAGSLLLSTGCEALAARNPPAGVRAGDFIHSRHEPLLGVFSALIGWEHPVVVDSDLQVCPRAAEGQPVLVRIEHLVEARQHDSARGQTCCCRSAHLECGRDRSGRGCEQDQDLVHLVCNPRSVAMPRKPLQLL